MFRRFAEADEGDVGVVLGNDDALVIDAGHDLDEDAAGGAVGVGRGEGVVVEGVDDGGEGCGAVDAGGDGGVYADVDVGGVEGKGKARASGRRRGIGTRLDPEWMMASWEWMCGLFTSHPCFAWMGPGRWGLYSHVRR